MNVVIIDDEELAIELLEVMLMAHEEVNVIGKYTDPILALSEINNLDVDVVFLDLDMGSLHGIQCAKLLYKHKPSIIIVFVTAYSQYAVEAFDLNAVDYLLKPVPRERLEKTVEKLKREIIHSKKEPRIVNSEVGNLYVHTLGMYWISIKEGSAPLKWRTKKVKELFAFLLHHKGHPVHRTLIIEELWPDTFVDKGVTLLHTTVYQLRKMLNEIGYENTIQYGNEQYILDINIDSDIKQFHNLIRLSTPNEEEIKALMTLYEGDYFEQEEYAWVIYDQQKIRKAFLQQIEIFIATLTMESPKDILLETCLTKMLQIDIYNDNYVYQLIQFYGRTGNKLRFMEVYNSYKSKLSEDLGLNVPYKFLKLYNEIVEGEA